MSAGLQTQSTPATGTFRILLCTGDRAAEAELTKALSPSGGEARVVTSAAEFERVLGSDEFEAVLVDLPTQSDVSSAWREELAQRGVAGLDVVLAVPSAREDAAKRLVGRSITAFVTKPCTLAQAASILSIAAENRRLRRRMQALESQLVADEPEDELVGCSAAIRRLTTAVSRAAGNDATVLIEGKAGTGKSLVARMIHQSGRRAQSPLQVVACERADDEALLSALSNAGEGTLVLEDIDRLPSRTQSRLVRVLKESSSGLHKARIVATTSAKLAELVAKGGFREDLYYRINMFPVVVPSLVERTEDVPILAQHFLAASCHRSGLPDRGFSPTAMAMLESNPWPGNITQLKNTVARAHSLADGNTIERAHLFTPAQQDGTALTAGGLAGFAGVGAAQGAQQEEDDVTEDDIIPFQEEEKRLLSQALRATRGNVRRAAQLLAIGRATLYRKIQIYKLTIQ
jgi:DNA-binding NtrC family response regulator